MNKYSYLVKNNILPISKHEFLNSYNNNIIQLCNKFHQNQPNIIIDNVTQHYGAFSIKNNKIYFNAPADFIMTILFKLTQYKTQETTTQKKIRPETVLCIASLVWWFDIGIEKNITDKYKTRTKFLSHKHLSSIKQNYHNERDWLIDNNFITCDKIKRFCQVDSSFNKCYTYLVCDPFRIQITNKFSTPINKEYLKIIKTMKNYWKDVINAEGVTTILPNNRDFIQKLILRDSILTDSYNWNNIFQKGALSILDLDCEITDKHIEKIKRNLISWYKLHSAKVDRPLINEFIQTLQNTHKLEEFALTAANNFEYFDEHLREQQKTSYYELADNLIQATYYSDHSFKCDLFSDRIHSRFTRMKKFLRNTLRVNNNEILEIDIVSSQLVMFLKVVQQIGNAITSGKYKFYKYEFESQCINKTKLDKEITEFEKLLNRDIYKVVSKFIYNKIDRKNAKILTFSTIFDNTNKTIKYLDDDDDRKKVMLFIIKSFPNIFKIMQIIKRYDYKNFVKNTQKYERNIISDILKKLKKQTFKISIHDSILIENTEENKQKLISLIHNRLKNVKISAIPLKN